MWVLTENTPVLVSAHSLRPANDAEALARSILNGQPIMPAEIIGDDQKFVDARIPELPQDLEDDQLLSILEQPANPVDVPIPEDEDDDDVIVEEANEGGPSSSSYRMPSQRSATFDKEK